MPALSLKSYKIFSAATINVNICVLLAVLAVLNAICEAKHAIASSGMSLIISDSRSLQSPLSHGQSRPLKLEGWCLSGDYATGTTCNQLGWNQSPNSFVLGLNSSNCQSGKRGGRASINFAPTEDRRVITLRINCPRGCASAVDCKTSKGRVRVAVDGMTLWEAECSSQGSSDKYTLGDSPVITFISEADTVHRIDLTASPDVIWPVSTIQTESRKISDLIQGIAYSPFRDCQNPNRQIFPNEEEILEDLSIIRNMGNAIRTYSSRGIQGRIAVLARQRGLRVSAGAWLGQDFDDNEKEIDSVIRLANTVDLDSVIVGNEVLWRNDLKEDDLISYIKRVKAAVRVPVTTAEISHKLLEHQRVMEVLDFHLVHIYGFWDRVPIEHAVRHVVERYRQFKNESNGKRVVIGETGWPSSGPPQGPAVPSPDNQSRFLQEFVSLAQLEQIEFYYFSAFDELWKSEEGVGPFWGIMDAGRHNKYNFQSILTEFNKLPEPPTEIRQGSSHTDYDTKQKSKLNEKFYVFHDYGAKENHFSPSGWMGDWHALEFNDCARVGADWVNRSIEIKYRPDSSQPNGWAGIYWLEPPKNWADKSGGGFKLTEYAGLRFRARGEQSGEEVKFFAGGLSKGAYPSSIKAPVMVQGSECEGFVTLTTKWQEFCIDVSKENLSNVIDGFGFVVERARNPDGLKFYLDDIAYDQKPCDPAKNQSRSSLNPSELGIYVDGKLASEFKRGVDSSERKDDWVTKYQGYMKAAYPAGQAWGAVFITVCQPDPRGERRSKDFSMYSTLMVDLKGELGNEIVDIGIKDSKDPDNGRETKLPVKLHKDWHTCSFPLSMFKTADLQNLYVPFELVFEPEVEPETVYFRNIKYSKQKAREVSCRAF